MFYSETETQELLRGIAYKLTSEPAQVEDLYQEAIIHLWLIEECGPRQTRSWYLQNCQHFMQDFLRAGRSVDSFKHAHQRMALDAEASSAAVSMGDEGSRELHWSEDEVVSTAACHELLEKLRTSASATEFKTLQMLFEGFTVNDIARSFGVSNTAIQKKRNRLTSLAKRLGVSLPGVSAPQKIKLSLVIQPVTDKAQPARAC